MPRSTHATAVFRALAECLAALDPLDEPKRVQVVGALDALADGWRSTPPARPGAGQPDKQLGGQLDQTLRGPLGEPLSQDGAR